MILYENLIQVLQEARGRDREIRFIDGENDESVLTFSTLWTRATELLGGLQARGMQSGDELVIFTRSNEQFVVAFWAAVLGGIVPVPVAVGISDEHRFKLVRILRQMHNGTLYTEGELRERMLEFAGANELPDIGEKIRDRTVLAGAGATGTAGQLASPGAGDIAFIQYSSGSTSDPKGVCLTHRNLCTNLRAIVEGLGYTEDDQSLSWMPLTHDMGLIGFHLSTLAAGMHHAVMDTSLFVRRPLLWMSKANELRASQLCSPNFGYKHFLKLFERKGLPDLDLSCVKQVLNGAEPISWELCEQFLDALAPHGLKRSAMLPVYGLAEATVAVTIPERGHEYSRIVADRHSLSVGEPYRPVAPDHPDAISFIKVGKAVRDVEIRACDDGGKVLDEGLVGNIQARGGSITGGLYDGAESSQALFTADGWLQTGDVGVLLDGELVITGRSKDIIIVNGQNYYPHDIEEIVAQVEGFDLGKIVACGVQPPGSQVEELVVFLLYRQDIEAFGAIAEQVRSVVGSHAGLEVDHVLPVARIPKTTSGKVQRAHLASAYLDGEFAEVAQSLAAMVEQADSPAAGEDPVIDELVAICREFSKERAIGPDDNLFETGVSSLTLTEIMLAVDEKFPGQVDIADLFDYPTIRELAGFMGQGSR